jgi:hypothetical protein
MDEVSDQILVIKAPCWKCDKEMLIALVGTGADFSYGPEDFSVDERKMAEKEGVRLEYMSSKTAEETYLANVCKDCGSFVGKFFLFAHYFAPAMYGHYEYKEITVKGENLKTKNNGK